MDPTVANQLIEINRVFYDRFGPAFAATRRRVQTGVLRVLAELPDEGRWLDLGCGSGALALEWLARGRQSTYLGLDFSPTLLHEAKSGLPAGVEAQVAFAQADLGAPDWSAGLTPGFRGVLAFAALHHLPSVELRRRLLGQARDLLVPGGWFVHSEWQFQHSPKLMERRLPWSTVGLDESALEPGDTLLDWRYALPGQAEQGGGARGLRYVHLYTRDELASLARDCGFTVQSEFESDGQGGRLGLYQTWVRL